MLSRNDKLRIILNWGCCSHIQESHLFDRKIEVKYTFILRGISSLFHSFICDDRMEAVDTLYTIVSDTLYGVIEPSDKI